MAIGLPNAPFDVTGVQLNDVIFDGFTMAGLQALKVSSLRIVGGSYNMNPILLHGGVRGALLMGATATVGYAQQPASPPRPFPVGNPVGMPVLPAADGGFKPIYVTASTSPPRLSENDFGNNILWANTGHQAAMP